MAQSQMVKGSEIGVAVTCGNKNRWTMVDDDSAAVEFPLGLLHLRGVASITSSVVLLALGDSRLVDL